MNWGSAEGDSPSYELVFSRRRVCLANSACPYRPILFIYLNSYDLSARMATWLSNDSVMFCPMYFLFTEHVSMP